MIDRKIKESLGWLAVFSTVLGLSALGARLIRGKVEDSPATSSPADVSGTVEPPSVAGRGRLLYQVHCVRCHGPDGHGDGPDASNLQPPPRDFASSNWRFSPSPESIRKVIVGGIAGTAMYPLGNSLSKRELDAVVEHVRSLAPKAVAIPASVGSSSKADWFEPASRPRPASTIEVQDLEGVRRHLGFGHGRATLLVFWGTSCAPCQEELPELERLATELQGEGLDVVPVCVDEADRATVRRVARGKFDRFPVYLSVDGMARMRYDVETLPVAALIDGKGTLVGMARGVVDWKGEPARRLIADVLAASR